MTTGGEVGGTRPNLFSAKLGAQVCARPPGGAPISRVRDVLLCIAGPTSASVEEFQAHRPIDGAAEHRESPATAGPVDLGLGVRIGQLPTDDQTLVLNACIPRGHYFFPVRHEAPRYALIADLPGAPDPFYGWDSQGHLWNALSFSRLIRDNGYSLAYAARVVDYTDGEQMVIYDPRVEGKAVYRLRNTRDWLDADEGRQLADLLRAFTAVEDLPPRLSRAIWRMEYSTWLGWADLALLIIVSGLESLVKTERSRATRQFTQRVTALAQDLGIDGVDAALCLRLYDARSEWAHGAHVRLFPPFEPGSEDPEAPTGEEARVLSDVSLLQDVLRGAVRRAIEDAEFRTLFLDDTTIRQRWAGHP